MDMDWSPVPGYEDIYEATEADGGAVRSLDRTITDGRGQVRHLRGKRLYPTSNQGNIILSRDGHQFHTTIADTVARTFAPVAVPA